MGGYLFLYLDYSSFVTLLSSAGINMEPDRLSKDNGNLDNSLQNRRSVKELYTPAVLSIQRKNSDN